MLNGKWHQWHMLEVWFFLTCQNSSVSNLIWIGSQHFVTLVLKLCINIFVIHRANWFCWIQTTNILIVTFDIEGWMWNNENLNKCNQFLHYANIFFKNKGMFFVYKSVMYKFTIKFEFISTGWNFIELLNFFFHFEVVIIKTTSLLLYFWYYRWKIGQFHLAIWSIKHSMHPSWASVTNCIKIFSNLFSTWTLRG